VSNVVRSEAWIRASYASQHSPASFYTVGPQQAQPAPKAQCKYDLMALYQTTAIFS
jgi:hypothetical protein